MSALLQLEEAQARLLALAHPLPIERVDTRSALGRYLAEPIKARRTQPAADLSAMDGYAVAGEDLSGPWTVIGESAAGHPFCGTVYPGQAVRIATGALLPKGTGSVIIQEDVERNGANLALLGLPPLPADKHIRRMGKDFETGAELLAAGSYIGAAQLALAISAGQTHLTVRRDVRVAIIDSGDELAKEPDCCAPHQIPASNGAMLIALVSSLPCVPEYHGPVLDKVADLVVALDAASGCDIIVTTGGASVGDHDLLCPALQQWGASIDFWKVAIKPGKPLLVAAKGDKIVLGLPGNPVSSYVTALLFLLPLIRALLGAAEPIPKALNMRLAAPVAVGGDRREFLRARMTADGLQTLSQQDSGALAALSMATAIIDRPAHAPALPAGADVPAILIGNGWIA